MMDFVVYGVGFDFHFEPEGKPLDCSEQRPEVLRFKGSQDGARTEEGNQSGVQYSNPDIVTQEEEQVVTWIVTKAVSLVSSNETQ